MDKITLLKQLIELYKALLKAMGGSEGQRLCSLAKSKLGTDFTNDQIVPDEVSCAYAVTTILKEFDPRFPIINGTKNLLDFFLNNMSFERVFEPQAGDIVVCATGTNTHPEIIPNGHTGIYQNSYDIMSNSSSSGLWETNYNRDTWRNRYYYKGGYAVYLFRLVDKKV